MDSIPEAIVETEKQEVTTTHRKKYLLSPYMVRTPRTPAVVKPSLDVIPEYNYKQSVSVTDGDNNVPLYGNTSNVFKGGKLNSQSIPSSEENNKHLMGWEASSRVSLQCQHKQHVVTAKIEDNFKSKWLLIGSKFGMKAFAFKVMILYIFVSNAFYSHDILSICLQSNGFEHMWCHMHVQVTIF